MTVSLALSAEDCFAAAVSDLLSRPVLVLSPHLDDAVFSVGGLLLQHDAASVVTVFSADPPTKRPNALADLASPAQRRQEDAAAMEKLGIRPHLLDLPDAIDRCDPDGKRRYPSLSALFGPVDPACAPICAQIALALTPLLEDRLLLCPMAVGAHVDHQLCSHVGRRLVKAGQSVLFYEDAPYVYPSPGPHIQRDTVLRAAARLRARVGGLEDVSIDAEAKVGLAALYATQIAQLFGDLEAYAASAQSHYQSLGGEMERLHHLRV